MLNLSLTPALNPTLSRQIDRANLSTFTDLASLPPSQCVQRTTDIRPIRTNTVVATYNKETVHTPVQTIFVELQSYSSNPCYTMALIPRAGTSVGPEAVEATTSANPTGNPPAVSHLIATPPTYYVHYAALISFVAREVEIGHDTNLSSLLTPGIRQTTAPIRFEETNHGCHHQPTDSQSNLKAIRFHTLHYYREPFRTSGSGG